MADETAETPKQQTEGTVNGKKVFFDVERDDTDDAARDKERARRQRTRARRPAKGDDYIPPTSAEIEIAYGGLQPIICGIGEGIYDVLAPEGKTFKPKYADAVARGWAPLLAPHVQTGNAFLYMNYLIAGVTTIGVIGAIYKDLKAPPK